MRAKNGKKEKRKKKKTLRGDNEAASALARMLGNQLICPPRLVQKVCVIKSSLLYLYMQSERNMLCVSSK